MVDSDGLGMAHRLGRIVGVAAFALVVLRLDRVLDTSPDTPDWRLVGVAAAVLGALVSWMGFAYRLGWLRVGILHLLGLVLVFERVAAGTTLRFGVIPGPDTAATLTDEIANALDILQFGAPPVLAVPGLTAFVAVGLWLLGAAWGWGAVTDHTWAGIVPSLGFYLYIGVLDRAVTGPAWMISFAVLAILGLISTTLVARPGTGRARDGGNRPVPRRRAGASLFVAATTFVLAIVGLGAVASVVDSNGAITWRNPGGAGTGLAGGGISYNLFVGLRQQVVSQSDEPVFVATVSENAPSNRQMYWRLITLDEYDGVNWTAGSIGFSDPTSDSWGDPEMAYRGPTIDVRQAIQIASLRQDYLPVLSSPVDVQSVDPLITSGLRVRDDGSLNVAGRTSDGLTYVVRSQVPVLDVAQLASSGGELTPIFEEASDAGLIDTQPVPDGSSSRPAVIDRYLELPGDVADEVAALAADVTAPASTPFERALLLEQFFRDDDRFAYDTSVTTGQGTLDMAAWLTDEESLNYRTGYCEQFATAMAVMGRVLDLPTRVAIGFTPGEAVERDDGTIGVEVQARNSHAWVEVWFDEAGWVRFDPTPRSDGVNQATTTELGFDPSTITPARADTSPQLPAGQLPGFADVPGNVPIEDITGLSSPVSGSSTPLWVWIAVAAAVLAAVLPLAKTVRRRRRLGRIASGDITAAWEEIVDRLSDLGSGPRASQTPIEFATSLDPSLMPLASAYSATVYGNKRSALVDRHFETAESWLHSTYGGGRRVRAAFNPKSLTP